jgi:hypothetical protein
MKAEHFAHFSQRGYGIFYMLVNAFAFAIGIFIGGFLGVCIASGIAGWALWKFPNVMHSWDMNEKYHPEMKDYRIDKF